MMYGFVSPLLAWKIGYSSKHITSVMNSQWFWVLVDLSDNILGVGGSKASDCLLISKGLS